jgi:transcription-repair coupling factor (superfamily II helicase)
MPRAPTRPTVERLLTQIASIRQEGGAALVRGLGGSAPASIFAQSLSRAEGPTLWVAPTEHEAKRVVRELQLFGVPARLLPNWDVAPYGGYSPSADASRRRLASLHALAAEPAPVIVAPPAALLKRVLPPAALLALAEGVTVGEDVDRDALVRRLVDRGYFSTDLCSEPGTFSVRGSILDVFAPSYEHPLRIDFWGDEVESIRTFDPHTQRSRRSLEAASILPIREEVITQAALDALPRKLKVLADARGVKPRKRIQIQDELRERRLVQEIELFLPLLRDEELVTVFDYLGRPGALLVQQEPNHAGANLFGLPEQITDRFKREDGASRLLPEPTDLFLSVDQLDAAAAGLPRLVFPDVTEEEHDDLSSLELRASDHGGLRAEILARKSDPDGMLVPLVSRARAWLTDKLAVLVVCRSRRRSKQLVGLLEPYDLSVAEHSEPIDFSEVLDPGGRFRDGHHLHVVPGDLDRGFSLPAAGLVVLCEADVFGKREPRKRARRPQGAEAIGSFAQLTRGDVVVHSFHGIGRFDGMVKLQLDPSAMDIKQDQRERAENPSYVPGSGGKAGTGRGSNNDFLLLRYRNDDRLYVPVHKLDQLSRYVAPGGAKPKLDKLGGVTWSKRKKKASEAAQKVARELLDLYARRQLARSHPFPPPDEMYREFAAGFPFDETPDQQAAIDAVLHDMGSPTPMDRLVCGDVGFGKTEIAMRAAFRAVEDGKQVAVLVPTTILALQHHQAFSERMKEFPVTVGMLSRFRTAAQQRKTIAGMKTGQVDIVIGTHRLLGRDVGFKDLGLLVVDEEHRFGVTHKEKIKGIRAAVDVLTLTATPIPRTLNLALSGIRDFSIIMTPPEGRQAVRTQVARFSPRRIVDSIRYELDRGGQVFFVHNRVRSIHKLGDWLRKLLPGVTMRVAHGQMNERDLEDIMIGFFRREFDLLLCTTIIESGIDVPTANTMIINRSDMLGLAQMHQLRGRVGRGRDQGHCYLLVPPGRTVRATALSRLKVLQDNSELGSGHRIAQHDLELRGTGNLLGRKQAGHVADVGLNTYMTLLEQAVKKLKGEDVAEGPEPEIELRADAYIPAEYVPDEAERLQEYKALADCRSRGELQTLLQELEDTFGAPPPEVLRFEQLIEVKVLARDLRVERLRTLRGGRMQLTISQSTPIDPMSLMTLVGAAPDVYTFRPDGVLIAHLTPIDKADLVVAALRLLSRLRDCVPAPAG